MTVGVVRLALHFPESGSLKTKRSALRSLLDGLRHRFNVSAAEVGHQDLWQRSTLAVATVNNDRAHAESTLTQTVNFVEGSHRAQVLDVAWEWH